MYTMATRLIKTTVVISLNPRPENLNPPTIAKMTVDGLKGRKRSWLNTINLIKMYPYVCTANLVNVSISFVKEQGYRVKHADDVVQSNRLLGDYYSMSEIFNIFIESAIHASPNNFDLFLRDSLDEVLHVFVLNNVDRIRSAPGDKLYRHNIFSWTILLKGESYYELRALLFSIRV